jgi:uncharacterized membrane protein
MTKDDPVFIYIGTYLDEPTAHYDLKLLRDLHTLALTGTYDAAVVSKDTHGKVHISKDEESTRHGAWGGAAVGAVVGLLFPPALIASAVVGGAAGGIAGHLWGGMSRSDVSELGELIDQGEAALIIVGEVPLKQALENADMKSEKHVSKILNVRAEDVHKVVQEAASEIG